MGCPAILKSGPNKGLVCNRVAKADCGSFCGIHRGGTEPAEPKKTVQCPPTPRPLKIGGVTLTRVLGNDCMTLKQLRDDVILAMTADKKYKTMHVDDRQYISELTEEYWEYKIKEQYPQLQHLPYEFETWTKLYEFLQLNDNVRLLKVYLPILRLAVFRNSLVPVEDTKVIRVDITDKKSGTAYILTIAALSNGLWSLSTTGGMLSEIQVKETKTNVNTPELLANLALVTIDQVAIGSAKTTYTID